MTRTDWLLVAASATFGFLLGVVIAAAERELPAAFRAVGRDDLDDVEFLPGPPWLQLADGDLTQPMEEGPSS